MKIILTLSLISLTILSACSLLPSCCSDVASNKPWIRQYIDNINNIDAESRPEEIWSYYHLQDTAYFFIMPCCDRFNTVYDYIGEKICAPDGGITGRGDFKCPEFFKTARKLNLVWSEQVRDRNPD